MKDKLDDVTDEASLEKFKADVDSKCFIGQSRAQVQQQTSGQHGHALISTSDVPIQHDSAEDELDGLPASPSDGDVVLETKESDDSGIAD